MKAIIKILIVIIILLCVGVGGFFTWQQLQEPSGQPLLENEPLWGEEFSIAIPYGWRTGRMIGFLATMTNVDEVHPEGSKAQQLNFKSYIAVSKGDVQERTLEEIAEATKEELSEKFPSITFVNISQEIVGDITFQLLELNLNEEEVDLVVLLSIAMKGDKYFVVSFNTTADKWQQEYQELFYLTAKSFKFRY